MTTGDEDVPPQGHVSPGPWPATALAIRFATELALLAVVVIVGVNLSAGLAARIALAVLGPVAVGVTWGLGIAPRARRRWPDPWRLVVEIVLFVAAAAGLAAEGYVIAATAFAAVAIGTALLIRVVAPGG